MAWLVGPVAVVLAVSLWLSWDSARRQAQRIMERDLTASARMIAEQVRYRDSQIEVSVPPAALELFVSNSPDEVAYTVFDPSGLLIAGFPGLNPAPAAEQGRGPQVYDTMFRTEAMHAVTLSQPVVTPDGAVSVTVTVGETTLARDALVRELWLRGFAEQAVLIVAAAVSIWIGISLELRPLMRLRRAVLGRPADSIEPFDETSVQRELRPLVAALNQHMARLSDYLARQRRFLDAAAHQLRTPLAVLKTQVGVARRSGEQDQIRETLTTMDTGLSGVTRVTNQLLMLGRIDHERVRLVAKPVDLRKVLRTVVSETAPRALDAGIDLVLEADKPCTVRANADLVREMVVNLVDNAIRYAGSGATATLSVSSRDGMGIVTVADNGCGISESDREGLLNRYARGSDAPAGGSGLGLTIVSEIAAMFGGSVAFPNSPGQTGFCVAIALPLVERPVAS